MSGVGMALGGGLARAGAAGQSSGRRVGFRLQMQFFGLIAHASGPRIGDTGQLRSWNAILVNDAASHIGAQGHRAALKVPLVNLVSPPSNPTLDATNPDLAVFDLSNVRLQLRLDGQVPTAPLQPFLGARGRVGAKLSACPGANDPDEWRDISWLARMEDVLGKGKATIRKEYVKGPWQPGGLVSALVPLSAGQVECSRPSRPGYQNVTYRFVQFQGAPPEPHERQFYTDIVRYMSNQAKTVTLSLLPFDASRPAQHLEIRAMTGQPAVTVFVENINPNAGVEFLDARQEVMDASHHFLAYYDLIDPTRRCLPQPSCCDAFCSPPVYCFSPLMMDL